jgi:hypothetical protein
VQLSAVSWVPAGSGAAGAAGRALQHVGLVVEIAVPGRSSVSVFEDPIGTTALANRFFELTGE